MYFQHSHRTKSFVAQLHREVFAQNNAAQGVFFSFVAHMIHQHPVCTHDREGGRLPVLGFLLLVAPTTCKPFVPQAELAMRDSNGLAKGLPQVTAAVIVSF